MKYAAALAIVFITTVSPVSASAQISAPVRAENVEQSILLGWIGPYRVGANITLWYDRVPIAAHYYYAKRPIDIPLDVKVSGEKVTFREPGGGVFNLRFETNDKTPERPLNFYTSTALVGTWTGNGRAYPVRLEFNSRGGPTGAERYGDVTNAPAPAFEALVQRFLDGAISGNRAKTASAVSFPLTVRDAKTYTVRNRAELYAHWPRIFTTCFIRKLKEAVPHEMFVRNDAAMVSQGAVWFDARGAQFINFPSCFND